MRTVCQTLDRLANDTTTLAFKGDRRAHVNIQTDKKSEKKKKKERKKKKEKLFAAGPRANEANQKTR